MPTWRPNRTRGQIGRDFYHSTVKNCVDAVVLPCLGDAGFINGKQVMGKYERRSLALGTNLMKETNTEEHMFCFPSCACPWVSCSMPFEYGGEVYRISSIKPSFRTRGWTCLVLKEKCRHKPHTDKTTDTLGRILRS